MSLGKTKRDEQGGSKLSLERGRGDSGDTTDYAIEREFDDIAAAVDSIGEPVRNCLKWGRNRMGMLLGSGPGGNRYLLGS